MGSTTSVDSSDKKGLFLEDFLLARFLNAIPKEMFECVALWWYGLNSG